MSKTTGWSNNLLDHEFRGQAFSATGTVTMKLSTVAEGANGDGSNLVEVTEPSYVAGLSGTGPGVPLTPATYFVTAASGGAISLDTASGTTGVIFGDAAATAAYNINAVYFEDPASGGAGIVRYKDISTIPVAIGQRPVIPDGGMTIQES